MTEKEWDRFFNLMGSILNLGNLTADERGQLIRDEAKKRDAESDLDEFRYEVSSTETEPPE